MTIFYYDKAVYYNRSNERTVNTFFPHRGGAVAYYRAATVGAVNIQVDSTHAFARKYGIDILYELGDIGQSSLLRDRPGLTSLFQSVRDKNDPMFKYVLLYEPSRWGRFQDVHTIRQFEMQCLRHGKRVMYVAETFIPFRPSHV